MRSAPMALAFTAFLAGLGVAGLALASDTYDKEATEVVLRRAARVAKENCGLAKDENGRATGPWGTTTVTVTLGRNGHSKGASVPAPFDNAPTGRCVVKAFGNLTFPPWSGADVVIEREVEIVKPEEEASAKSKKK